VTKPIAVLGCGPAGLMAAHACAIAGKEFVILSRPERSMLGGAQFLHAPIPLINDEPPVVLTYHMRGNATTYREKVYGIDPTVPFVSFSDKDHGDEQDAWNLIETYDRLWSLYGNYINPLEASAQWIDGYADNFSLILSTVPLVHICAARAGLINEVHNFQVQDIYVYPDEMDPIPDNTVLYDGTGLRSWYRTSHIFGTKFTEWSGLATKPPLSPLFKDSKPIHTSCNCWDGKVVRLGRRGTWTKGVLAHHAFLEALKVVAA